jgi:hypothetical protein
MAHHNLAFACVSYLVSGFYFVDPGISYDSKRLAVAEGFHSLHLYANAFWLDHVLDLATDPGKALDSTFPGSFTNQIQRLCATH